MKPRVSLPAHPRSDPGSPPPLQIVSYVFLLVLLVIVIFPFYWMTVTSLKSETQMRSLTSMFWPRPAILDNYRQLVTQTDFGAWYGNSVTVALTSTFLATAIGTIGAYSLARLRYRGRAFMASGVLITYLVPPSILFIPLYAHIRNIGLSNSLSGLIATYPSFTVPFVTWLLMGYFESIPEELEEAAMIDGATRLQTFARAVLPMVRGGMAATAVLCFIFSWTEFLLSLFLTNSIRTLPVKITTFVTSTGSEWGFIAALGTSAIVPSFIFILLVQKQLVRGLTFGSLKE